MDELFPLPVTAFEYYYLCDDRPEYPTTTVTELIFSGQMERGPLEGALELVLRRHPLLTARIDTSRGRRPNWVAGDLPQIGWASEDEPVLPSEGAGLDLTQFGGMQIFVRQGADRTRIVFLVHHASADGMAGARFVEELMLAYHALFDANCPPLPPLEQARLEQRDPLEDPERRLSLADFWPTVKFWTRTLLRTPTPLAVSNNLLGSPASGRPGVTSGSPLGHVASRSPAGLPPILPLEYFTAALSADQSKQLRRVAAAQGATLNDLLIRDLLLAAADWNLERGERRDYLRINVPTTLRDRFDKLLPACNVLGFGFVSARVRPDNDGRRLLALVCNQTERMKREQAGMQFLSGLGLACLAPGLVPWALNRRRSFATLVLSNLGKAFPRVPLPRRGGKLVCGHAILERVTCVPPVRPLTRGGIVVVNYGEEMTLNLRVDPHCLTRQDAYDFLRCYVARLETSIAERGVVEFPVTRRQSWQLKSDGHSTQA